MLTRLRIDSIHWAEHISRKIWRRWSRYFCIVNFILVRAEDEHMEKIIDAVDEISNELGPGFSESIYHRALERELSERGIPFHSEGTISVMYKGAPVGRRRPDLFIVRDGGVIILELKASGSGRNQLEQYIDLVSVDDNFGELLGGAVVNFGDGSIELWDRSINLSVRITCTNCDTTEQYSLQEQIPDPWADVGDPGILDKDGVNNFTGTCRTCQLSEE